MEYSTTGGSEVGSQAGSHAGTVDLTGIDSAPGPQPQHYGDYDAHPESIDRTPSSSRSYGGPTMRHHSCAIVAGIVALGLLATTIALSATSLQRSNEAMALSNANAASMESNQAMMNGGMGSSGGDIPPLMPAVTPPPTPKPTTANPTAQPTTSKPTEPHPLNPQWFQTTHRDFQYFQDLNANGDLGEAWHLSNAFCSKQQMYAICPYEAYCQNGQGTEPFGGGPPETHNWGSLEKTQWAPFLGEAEQYAHGVQWVQIGLLQASDGGDDDNGFGKCWKFDDWYAGSHTNIADVWGEEHRMWILCCEKGDEDGDV